MDRLMIYETLVLCFGYNSQVTIRPKTKVEEAVSIKWLMRTLFDGMRELGRM